jgi:hypothetical protein
VEWISQVLHPIEPYGDYFDRLESSIASSAPVCVTCG